MQISALRHLPAGVNFSIFRPLPLFAFVFYQIFFKNHYLPAGVNFSIFRPAQHIFWLLADHLKLSFSILSKIFSSRS